MKGGSSHTLELLSPLYKMQFMSSSMFCWPPKIHICFTHLKVLNFVNLIVWKYLIKASFFASQSVNKKKLNKTTFQILSWISNKNSRQILWTLLCPEIRVISIKLQRNGEYCTWHFSHLCCTMYVDTLTNRSQPFSKEEHQKCHFVHLCIFIISLFWSQEFNRKHFKVFYSLSVCIDWTLQHFFISISPSVPEKCTAVHQCLQSRHAGNDFSYPYFFPPSPITNSKQVEYQYCSLVRNKHMHRSLQTESCESH